MVIPKELNFFTPNLVAYFFAKPLNKVLKLYPSEIKLFLLWNEAQLNKYEPLFFRAGVAVNI